ncbi:hypothetical protein T12_8391 [Trichinella patagoniensis]|uniref:Uncharacterized protein n=1 Tax=Trichinella patagoniensis TaxID=990121 RepID=A0A0V0YRV5_9BILA|nr:hypothetical protein T12_8391 [Trichinella patagoniensis]
MVHGRQQQDAFLSLQDVAHKSELSIETKSSAAFCFHAAMNICAAILEKT